MLSAIVANLMASEPIVLEPIEVAASYPKVYSQSDFYTQPEMKQREFTLQETAPGFTNPNINGVMGDRVSLTLDGTKYSNATFRSGPNQYYSWIPTAFVTNLSLDKADSQLAYANVNRDLGIDRTSFSTEYTGYNDGTNVQAKYKGDKVSVGVVKKNYGNVETAKGEVDHTSYNQLGLYADYKSDMFGTTKFLFSESHDIDRTDKFEQGKPLVYEKQQYMRLSNRVFLDTYELNTLVSQSIENINDYNSAPNKHKTSVIKDTMVGADIKKHFNRATVGVSEYHEYVTYQNDLVSVPDIYNDFGVDTASVYGMFELPKIGDAEQSIKLDATMQYFKGPTLTYENNAYFSVNGAYEVELKDVELTLSRSTRNPTLSNLAFDMTGVNGTGTPNPNLKPEVYKEVKLGYTPIKGITVYGYYSHVDNYIVSLNNINDNIDAVLKGVGLKVNKEYGDLKIDGNVQYQSGETDLDYVDKIVPYFGNVKVEYKGAMVEYLFSSNDDHQSEGDLADTRIIGHNVGYKIVNVGYSASLTKNDKISVTGYNMFNNEGRVYGSSVDFYGRTFGAKWTHSF